MCKYYDLPAVPSAQPMQAGRPQADFLQFRHNSDVGCAFTTPKAWLPRDSVIIVRERTSYMCNKEMPCFFIFA